MQADIKSVYLYASISEEIFMYQPQGYVDPNRENWVYQGSQLDRYSKIIALAASEVQNNSQK